MKIYTKTGDTGETSLLGGRRVSKVHAKIEAYGTVDELNALVGILADQCSITGVQGELRDIQNTLFVIGSQLASDPGHVVKGLPDISHEDVEHLEKKIDTYTKDLRPLKNFILPSGHPEVSATHHARAVCRRVERSIVFLAEQEEVEDILIQYMNRLSDYLFTLARFIAHTHAVEEVEWKGL
ncbi:MAG: cob(I)yrinic acid a,c-diamide adenosyltransferase [Patescibacteria group bacterium]